jgi:hypothetical protein
LRKERLVQRIRPLDALLSRDFLVFLAVRIRPHPHRGYTPRIVSLTALREHPRFARFFEEVHPFFWPVICWTLNAVFRQYDASNRTEFLLGITWWGQVYIVFEGDLRHDPPTSRPLPRTFRPLTDES